MTKLGFTHMMAENCFYVFWKHNKIFLIVLIYVDDIAIAGKEIPGIVLFKQNLSKDFKIINLSQTSFGHISINFLTILMVSTAMERLFDQC